MWMLPSRSSISEISTIVRSGGRVGDGSTFLAESWRLFG